MSTNRRRRRRVDQATREEIRLLVGQGLGQREAAQRCGCSERTVRIVLSHNGGVKQRVRKRSPRHLTLVEREEIAIGLAAGHSQRQIARRLGRSPSTIGRELDRNGGPERYRAVAADRAAWERALRPKPSKLSRSPRLRGEVSSMLCRYLSPQQIARRLQKDHPDDESMHVSHETIYKSLFVQSRGEFRRELTGYLRTGRTRRKPAGEAPAYTNIRDKVMISERPAEADDRAVPGHWEGDLLLGKDGKSAIVTLVERSTRFVILGRIGRDRTSESVTKVIQEQIQTLPDHLKRSLTWDQGSEMSRHKQFTIDTGVQVYFCDPKSPWQRGSNENTNGLLRQFFPKGTGLSRHTQDELDEVARLMNHRPRETLGWDTPAEKLAELLR